MSKKSAKPEPVEVGWGCPDVLNPRAKYHFFGDDGKSHGKSLCGKWLNVGGAIELFNNNHESPENCAECRRRHKVLAALAGEERTAP